MTDYVLDISKWRCGDSGKHLVNALHPSEITSMMNSTGHMCCLGQFAKNMGVSLEILRRSTSPCGVVNCLTYRTGNIYDDNFVVLSDTGRVIYGINTPLADQLMRINDDTETTIEAKIKNIGDTLVTNGHSLTVVGYDWLNDQRMELMGR